VLDARADARPPAARARRARARRRRRRADHRIADALTRQLGTLGVERPAVDVTVVDAIERTAAGKLRIVVPDRLPEAPVA
jgi:hypothetical protein